MMLINNPRETPVTGTGTDKSAWQPNGPRHGKVTKRAIRRQSRFAPSNRPANAELRAPRGLRVRPTSSTAAEQVCHCILRDSLAFDLDWTSDRGCPAGIRSAITGHPSAFIAAVPLARGGARGSELSAGRIWTGSGTSPVADYTLIWKAEIPRRKRVSQE
jgi:hypothetical protein